MSKGIGRILQVGVAKETVRGTSEAAATYYIPFSDASIEEKDEKALRNQSRGIIEESVGEDIVRQWAEGSITAPLTDKSFGLILLATFGTCTTGANVDGSGTIKDHVFTVAQSAQHQALSIFLDDPLGGQDYKFAMGVISSLEINYERGKFIEFSANFMSKKGATATLTPSATTENLFLPNHFVFKVASAQSGLTAATAIPMKSLKLSIEKNVEADDVLGSLAPADFLNKQFIITGELEAIWQNESDFKTAALAGTAQAMRLDLLHTVTIGTAAKPQLRIDLNSVVFGEFKTPIKIDDVMVQTLSFKAHYSTTDSKMVTATLTNAVASY
ncbi:MAG: phage tail tube protein [bacterium]|nr:phage tail tube protein [bacterium]